MNLKWSFLFYSSSLIGLIYSTCNIYETGVSLKDRLLIVNEHNNMRTLVAQGKLPGQPKAVNMKRMKWDADLAKSAQAVANTCEFKHKNVYDARWHHVGQNIGQSKSTVQLPTQNWNRFMQLWFAENKKYTYSNKPVNGTGHYTQIVWATTTNVGCGFSSFKLNDQRLYYQLYVCNYGPGGNVVNVAPYQTGTSHLCDDLC